MICNNNILNSILKEIDKYTTGSFNFGLKALLEASVNRNTHTVTIKKQMNLRVIIQIKWGLLE